MKILSIAIASIIFTGSCFASSETESDNDTKDNKKKNESIESLLAEKNLTQGKIAKRIRTYDIETWRRLNNYHIFIEGKGKNNDYLIEFSNRCYNTRNGSTLIYKTRNNELTKFDSIGVLDSFISSHDVLRATHNCTIKEIYHLNKSDNENQTNKKIEKKEKKEKNTKERS